MRESRAVEPPPTARRFISYMAGIFLVMLFVVYPLSMGPAAYYVTRYNPANGPAFLDTFYRPVIAAYWAIPWLQRPIDAYTGFWERLAEDGPPDQTPPRPPAKP